MAVNKYLTEKMCISEEDESEIEAIHEVLSDILKTEINTGLNDQYYDVIEDLEFELQSLWGFPKDASKHTWKNRYKFKCQWAGRKFMCFETGETFTIPDDVEETDFYPIGKGYIDVGRLDSYNRWSGVKEIV